MAIESTLNQQRKYLRCHMKPALFLQSKRQLQSIPTYLVSEELHI